VQNKFHYKITGKTAAEIVYDSANKNKEHMGLTSWKNSPDGRILQSNVVIAKNYLSEKEIRSFERNVSAYFDYVECLHEETLLGMKDFATSIDEFLKYYRYEILEGHILLRVQPSRKRLVNIMNSTNIKKSSLILIGRLKSYKESRNE
jgi:hypothetical protein